MITVEYKTNIVETTNATLDFLSRRPIMRILILLMRFCCITVGIAYIIKSTTGSLTIHDTLVVVFAMLWLFGQRSINSSLLKRKLKLQKINDVQNRFQLSQHKLCWQASNNSQQIQQPWRQVKYIYQNKDGYIIPSPGMANTGKFVWLPKRGFATEKSEQDFLQLMQNLKIVLK